MPNVSDGFVKVDSPDVLAVGLLVAADGKKDDVKDKLKGAWTVVAMEEGGRGCAWYGKKDNRRAKDDLDEAHRLDPKNY
jgi:hypothetical protein